MTIRQHAIRPQLISSLSGLHFKARYIMEGFLTGQHDSPFHGFSVEFSEYRSYQPGDELKHVDWRLFARRIGFASNASSRKQRALLYRRRFERVDGISR